MAYQIVRVRQEPMYAPRQHQHIVAVELSNGQRLTRQQVIVEIRRGVEFYTYANGQRARVYIRTCPTCHAHDYITTTPDGTPTNNLDNLPTF